VQAKLLLHLQAKLLHLQTELLLHDLLLCTKASRSRIDLTARNLCIARLYQRAKYVAVTWHDLSGSLYV